MDIFNLRKTNSILDNSNLCQILARIFSLPKICRRILVVYSILAVIKMNIKINQKTKYPLELNLYAINLIQIFVIFFTFASFQNSNHYQWICKKSWNLWWEFYFAYLIVLLTFKASGIWQTYFGIRKYSYSNHNLSRLVSTVTKHCVMELFRFIFISQHKIQQFSIYT